ncbi:dynamin family protein [Alteribacillus sp. HJP-4]|uniref:dynamin family protein n=1 Tax=Alteribacillus sp. HJP-4 TaxID=2775394 RepID=UPI0035CCCB9E
MSKLQAGPEAELESLPFREDDYNRLRKLKVKAEEESFEVAFCGHFSAGKSTLLNRLLGNELLPTSPIPTSANIISIQNGPVGLKVTKSTGEIVKWEDEIPWNEARRWGMDGKSVRMIDIYAPLPFLGAAGRILDTPGVDSTDPDHQKVTMDRLYTSDMVVYVTDYNHVQSDTNIRFLQQLSNEKKPIVLVINQIDKHEDKELSVQAFERSIRGMLARSSVSPLEIFFTSMKKDEHALNQYDYFAQFIKAVMFNSEDLIKTSLKTLENGSVHHLIEKLEEEKQEAFEYWKEAMHNKGSEPEAAMNRAEVEKEWRYVEEEKQQAIQSLYQERSQLFDNVTLFPYSTTEKAREWLESQQKHFKVGFLFSSKKTEEEKQKRSLALINEVNENIQTQLLIHVKKMLLKADTSYLENDEEFEKQVRGLELQVDESFLASFSSTGEINRQFVYTFTGNVTASLVKQLKKASEPLNRLHEQSISRSFDEKKIKLSKVLEQSRGAENDWSEWEKKRAEYNAEIETCINWLKNRKEASQLIEMLKKASHLSFPDQEPEHISVEQDELVSKEAAYEWEEKEFYSIDESFLQPLKTYLSMFRSNHLFQDEKNDLADTLKEYQQNTIKISLFGAFSAGKSSFINAMLGDTVVPVSPHPTTAAVNIVKQSEVGFPHGTVVLQMKEKKLVNQEIVDTSRQLNEEVSIDSIADWKKPAPAKLNEHQKTYAQYLFTLQQSLSKEAIPFGEEKTTSLEQLNEWVANEQKACMIKQVTVYYDCGWTNKGLEIIDTPGVNSIHSRHTNVAFEQLKYSDAIFYLTYFNHAFSKSDELFLQQLGRINENFDEDKLFFIINAADLADTQEELNGVTNHVLGQLKKNGIERPRLTALSSKEGLYEKQNNTDGKTAFRMFEDKFSNTVWTALKLAHAQRLKKKWTALQKSMKNVLRDMEEHPSDLTDILNRKKNKLQLFSKQACEISFEKLTEESLEELKQQCTFLKQRIRFITQDYFSHIIHPGTIYASTKKQQKQQLQGALQELESFVNRYLQQEQEALMIRIEELQKNDVEIMLQHKISSWQMEFPTVHKPEVVPEIPRKYEPYENQEDKGKYLAYYKSAKDFFENRKVLELKETFSNDLQLQLTALTELFEKRSAEAILLHSEAFENQCRDKLLNSLKMEEEKAESLYDHSRKHILEEEYASLSTI